MSVEKVYQKSNQGAKRKEMELVLKMIGTDYRLAKSFWGNDFTEKAFYEMHPEKHPLDKYVNQLIGDLEYIRQNYVLPDLLERLGYYQNDVLPKTSSIFDDIDEEMLEEGEGLFEEKLIDTTFEELTTVEKVSFPPAEKLCESQIQRLSFVLQKLLNSLGIDFLAPNYCEGHYYVLLRKYWNNRTFAISDLGNYVTWRDEMDQTV